MPAAKPRTRQNGPGRPKAPAPDPEAMEGMYVDSDAVEDAYEPEDDMGPPDEDDESEDD